MSNSELWGMTSSKSQLKREAEQLQELGVQLLELPESQLTQLNLPYELAQALADAKEIKSKNAYRRQLQFIGRVMRKIDIATVAAIEQALQQWQFGLQSSRQQHKQLEAERERLIEGDQALLSHYLELDNCDKNLFKQVVRQAQNEAKTGHKGKAYTRLFQLLRDLQQAL